MRDEKAMTVFNLDLELKDLETSRQWLLERQQELAELPFSRIVRTAEEKSHFIPSDMIITLQEIDEMDEAFDRLVDDLHRDVLDVRKLMYLESLISNLKFEMLDLLSRLGLQQDSKKWFDYTPIDTEKVLESYN